MYIMKFKLFLEAMVNDKGEILGIENDIFDEFPETILKTLENYRWFFTNNFDWNQKMSELCQPKFNEWYDKNKQEQFIKKLDTIISLIREDLLTIKRKKMAERKLEYFEELIKPVLGNNITCDALSKFEEEILLNPYATVKQLEDGFRDAKNIIDEEGDIDYSKITNSTIFTGGEVNYPKFEEYVKQHPEYEKTYKVWKKLFDEHGELMVKKMNSYHIVSYKEIRRLYDYLIEFRNTKNNS